MRRFYAGLGLAWTTGLLALSFLPGKEKQRLHTHGRFHAYGHFAAFLLTVMVLLRAVRHPRGRVLMVAGLAGLACAVEYVQALHDGYGVEWHDVVTDLLGISGGTMLVALIGGMRDSDGLRRRPIRRLRDWRRRSW